MPALEPEVAKKMHIYQDVCVLYQLMNRIGLSLSMRTHVGQALGFYAGGVTEFSALQGQGNNCISVFKMSTITYKHKYFTQNAQCSTPAVF